MPFYISQIDGTQIPYEPLASAELRELGRPEFLKEIEAVDYQEASPAAYNDIQQDIAQPLIPRTYSSTATSLAASTLINPKSQITKGERLDSTPSMPRNKPIVPIQKSKQETNDFSAIELDNRDVIDAYAKAGKEKNNPSHLVVKVGEIMTSPVLALNANSSIEEVWSFIQEKRFRHVPIVTQENKLIGIVSDRDFIKVKQADNLSSVTKIITSNIITARPETDIRSAAKLMFDERIGALPVVNDSETLVGILTRTDILRVLYKRAPLELWS